MSGVLIQKSHGLQSATFAAPTQAGNIVAVVIGAPIGSFFNLFVWNPTFGDNSDDQHNLYNNNVALESSPAGLQTDCWSIVTPLPPNSGILTVGVRGPDQYVWIYELDCTAVTASPNFDNAFDITDGETGAGSPTGFDGGAVGGAFNPPPTAGDFVVTILALENGTVTAGPAGWTADAVQGPFSVFYNWFANGTHPIPHFTVSDPSTGWCLTTQGFATGQTSLGPPSNPILSVTTPTGTQTGTSIAVTGIAPLWGFHPNVAEEFPDHWNVAITASGSWSVRSNVDWLSAIRTDSTHCVVEVVNPNSNNPNVTDISVPGTYSGVVTFTVGSASSTLTVAYIVSPYGTTERIPAH